MARRLGLLAALLLFAAATAQGDEAWAAFRFVHLSPDAPLVDVLVDGRLTLRDVGARGRSGFVALPPGRHEFRVFPHRLPDTLDELTAEPGAAPAAEEDLPERAGAPAPEDAPAPAARRAARPLEPVVALVDLPPGSWVTLALTGNFEPPTAAAGLGHLSLAIEPADALVTVTGPQGFLAQRRGAQLFEDLEPGGYLVEANREGFQEARYEVEVQPGSTAVVTLALQAADDGEGAASGAPFEQRQETEARWRQLELQPYEAEPPLPPPGRAFVRIVHTAPNAPELAVGAVPSAEEEAAPEAWIERLGYPNESEYLPLDGGTYRLEFRVAGTEDVLHAIPELHLRPGGTYTLFLADDPVRGRLEVVPVVDGLVPQRPPREGSR